MSHNYYLALVEPDNSVVILQNTKQNKVQLKQYLTENSRVYRVRGHTVDNAIEVLGNELGVSLIHKKLPRKVKYDTVEEISLED